ncbi:serine hydrolase domain-containing protein [Erythrobacter sp. SG61-1L]|uniref:serine hydrolase domain-containing protein n=1 Tax=Erythrobacter sp. SG61-1L TaxID=1603897 RepID=UPI0006C92EC1|nr:serine hydrolase domain-containing protein [Erythrobacter sp. SG61-1L]
MAKFGMARVSALTALGLALGAFVPAAPAYAETAAVAPLSAVTELHDGLAAMIADGTLPNAQVVIARGGKDIVRFHMGDLDRESATPLPEDAIFRLYSMTKPITTVAAMMLVEEGRISLDAPIARYIPEFADMRVYESGDLDHMVTVPATRQITVRDLMTHSSGLTYNFTGNTPVQQYYRKHGVMRGGGVGRQPGDAAPAASMDELIARLAAAPLLHQPGERFSYSNSTGVLGVVVERASGMPLDRFFKERIFDPLEMHDATFVVSDAQLPRFVTNYTASKGGMTAVETAEASEYRDPQRMFDGGGALAATMEDYLHFAQMLANRGEWHGRRLIKAESVDAMLTPLLQTGGQAHENVMFGLGLGIGDAASEAIGGMPAGAGGWSGSGNTYFFADPRRNLVAILMTNELIGGEFTERTVRIRTLLDRAAVEVGSGQ